MRARLWIPVPLGVVLVAVACDASPDKSFSQSEFPSLAVAPSIAVIPSGGRLQLSVTARDETGQTTNPSNVSWTSSNTAVAQVSGDGVVTARTTGSVEIAAYWSGTRGISRVEVVGDAVGGPPCDSPGSRSRADLAKICVRK
jgi:hypothetical protein